MKTGASRSFRIQRTRRNVRTVRTRVVSLGLPGLRQLCQERGNQSRTDGAFDDVDVIVILLRLAIARWNISEEALDLRRVQGLQVRGERADAWADDRA